MEIKISTLKKYALVLCLFVTCSLAYSQQEIHWTQKDLGLYIENGERQGFQYFDAAGNEYSYRYVTTTIYNDTVTPVQIDMEFKSQFYLPCEKDSVKFNVFLLPSSLTPQKIQKDSTMSAELKYFLDNQTKKPESFSKLLMPKETCVVTFGVLTSIKHSDPVQFGLISKGHEYEYYFYAHHNSIAQATASHSRFALTLGVEFSTVLNIENVDCFLVMPCGQISFPKQ